MKKYKKILLLILVLLLTGCSGSYTIKVNDDLTIKESLNVTLENRDGLYDKAKKLFDENEIDEEKYEITQSSDKLMIKYTEDYSSFLSYIIDSKLYKQLYKDKDFDQDKSSISFAANSKFKLDSNNSSNIINDYNISLFQIILDTPFDVKYNNADEVYNNKYTWNLNSSTTEKEINFTMSNTYTSSNYIYIIVIILISMIVIGFVIYFLSKFIRQKRI